MCSNNDTVAAEGKVVAYDISMLSIGLLTILDLFLEAITIET